MGEGRRARVHNGEIERKKEKRRERVGAKENIGEKEWEKEMERSRAKKGSSGGAGTVERFAEWLPMWF